MNPSDRQQFRNGSLNCSRTIPEQFRNISGTVPEQFRNSSRTVPEQFGNNSGTVPEEFRNSSGTDQLGPSQVTHLFRFIIMQSGGMTHIIIALTMSLEGWQGTFRLKKMRKSGSYGQSAEIKYHMFPHTGTAQKLFQLLLGVLFSSQPEEK